MMSGRGAIPARWVRAVAAGPWMRLPFVQRLRAIQRSQEKRLSCTAVVGAIVGAQSDSDVNVSKEITGVYTERIDHQLSGGDGGLRWRPRSSPRLSQEGSGAGEVVHPGGVRSHVTEAKGKWPA